MKTIDRPLRVLIVAAEMVPYAKSGEVADVVGSLARALLELGHDVRVAMPRYKQLDAQQLGLELCLSSYPVPMNNHESLATAYCTTSVGSAPTYLIDSPRYFGQNTVSAYGDDAEPFVFFCRATLELLRPPGISWRPDIIHCHDWQTAIIPNWLATLYRDDPAYSEIASVFTVHRLSHQGIFGYRVLEAAGIQEFGFLRHVAITDLAELVDLTARGIYYADAVTTVSESYAQEIQTPEFGERLDPLLREHKDRLFGILNGIDTKLYDPINDPEIESRFDASSLGLREANKLALQRLFDLEPDMDIPIIGMISRLSDEKGLDLLVPILDDLMSQLDLQLAIVGVGEPTYHDLLSGFAEKYPRRIGVQLTFSTTLERRIYAGSDMFLKPSRVEPCGLGHMLAMRYGSVPIVRETGGLADTVSNYDPRTRSGNGFSFIKYDGMALYTAIVRAVEIYHHHDLWRLLQLRCLSSDFSWSVSAGRYVDIYRWAQGRARVDSGQ